MLKKICIRILSVLCAVVFTAGWLSTEFRNCISSTLAGGIISSVVVIFLISIWIFSIIHFFYIGKYVSNKFLWGMVLLFGGFVGGLFYYFLVYEKFQENEVNRL